VIISRAPFRVTLAGGGTDLPAFYQHYGGSVTSMAIDKYIYVSYKKNLLDKNIRLQYLKTEYVDHVSKLKHARARTALEHFEILNNCEISSMADLPSRSGLGSSGSYLVALISALQQSGNLGMSKHEIAELACKIEMEDLKEPVGKQDQYIASYGSLQTFHIDREGNVTAEPLGLSTEAQRAFQKRCRIYYTGVQRDASDVLKSQTVNRKNFENKMLRIRDLGHKFVEALRSQNYDTYGQLLDTHWNYKKELSEKMTAPHIDRAYSELRDEGLILGGKIIGAGGGGFLMVYVPTQFRKVDAYMKGSHFTKLNYGTDLDGTKIIYGDK